MEERTARLGEQIIDFVKILPNTITVRPLATQLIRSGTSIGANYSEADKASSKKEIKETTYWLRMIAYALPELRDKMIELRKEVRELNLIFASIVRKTKGE